MLCIGSLSTSSSSQTPTCFAHTYGGCCDVANFANNAWGTYCPEPWPSTESYFCEVKVVAQQNYFGVAPTTLGYTIDRFVDTPLTPPKICTSQRPFCDLLSPTGCSHYEETITIRCTRTYSAPVGNTNCPNEL
jgi:hypothetical protein